MINNKTRA